MTYTGRWIEEFHDSQRLHFALSNPSPVDFENPAGFDQTQGSHRRHGTTRYVLTGAPARAVIMEAAVLPATGSAGKITAWSA